MTIPIISKWLKSSVHTVYHQQLIPKYKIRDEKDSPFNIHNETLLSKCLSNINSKIILTGKKFQPSTQQKTENKWDQTSGRQLMRRGLQHTMSVFYVNQSFKIFSQRGFSLPHMAVFSNCSFPGLISVLIPTGPTYPPTVPLTVFPTCVFLLYMSLLVLSTQLHSQSNKPPSALSSKCLLFHSVSLSKWYKILCIPLIKPQSSPTQKKYERFLLLLSHQG